MSKKIILLAIAKFAALILLILSFPLGASADNLFTNGNFSGGNSGFSTGYGYVASGQSTTVGTYGIRTSSTNFNTGYNTFGDHTTGSGNMMLIDGAGSAGIACWSSTVGVHTNQTYYFSAWLTLSDSSNPSVIRFTINGVQLGSDLTLTMNPGVWQNTTLSWNSTTNTSATIAIFDENTVSLGNDFALDDLSFGTNIITLTPASIYTAVEIDWASQTNANYQVQYATSLASTNWVNFGSVVAGNGATNMVFDSTRGRPARFYRVEIVP